VVPPAASPGGGRPAEHAVLDLLAQRPGFDLARGLASLRGDAEKYLALLRRFLGSRVGDMDTLDTSLSAGDHLTARRLAHTLYGSAATLGARRLAELARELESALHENGGSAVAGATVANSAAAIAAEYRELAAVLPSIAPAGPAGPPAVGHAPLDAVRERLDALLASNDIDAIAYFRDHAAQFEAGPGGRGEALGMLIEGFEFDAARRALKAPS
jgi:HPt (histidine-containing phosphotransfer) domain-containing protein